MNVEMVEGGYAQVWIIPPNDEHEEELLAAQEEARSMGLGIWGLPSTEQAQLADRGNGVGSGDGACAPERQEGQYQYDEPDAPNPDLPNPNAPSPSAPPPPLDPYGDWTCDEIGGGPYSVPPGSPHDRDGDGLACE